MTRHILIVDSPRTWRVVHPGGAGEVPREACERLEAAARVFMNLPGLPEPVIQSWRQNVLWILATIVDLIRGPKLSVSPGAYWCDVGDDGNFEIGSQLPTAQAFVYVGRL